MRVNYFKGKRSTFSAEENAPTVLSKNDEITKLDANTKFVHFSYRPTIMDICNLLDSCPRLEKVQAPGYVLYALSDTAKKALQYKKVEIIEGTVTETQKKVYLFGHSNN